MAEKSHKTKKSHKIIIGVVILLLVIAISVGGYFLYENKKANEPLGTDWADIYYEYLKERPDKNGVIVYQTNECEVQFVPREDNYPFMVIEYDAGENEKKTSEIFYIDEKNEANSLRSAEVEGDTEIELLYDREEGKYKWYEVTEYDDYYNYVDLEEYLKSEELIEQLGGYDKASNNEEYKKISDKMHRLFYENEMPTKTKDDTTISKFEKTFVIPENIPELEKVDIDYINDAKETKKKLREVIKGYKTMDDVVTEKVKQSVTKEIEKIAKREEAIKKKAEEDAARKAQEEENRKAEEAKKGLKVGGYTIKYGTYVGYSQGPNSGVSLILKQNGQCEYKGQACTYTIGNRNFSQDPTPDYKECLIISYGRYTKELYPYNASTIGDGDVDSYDYKG